jgi:hypothetical protein
VIVFLNPIFFDKDGPQPWLNRKENPYSVPGAGGLSASVKRFARTAAFRSLLPGGEKLKPSPTFLHLIT